MMQAIQWLNDQRRLLLTRLHTHFVHATALFVVLACGLWFIIPHPIIPVAIGLIPLALLITISQPVLLGLLFIAFSFFRLHEAFAPLYSLKIPLMLSLGTLTTLAWHIGISGKIRMFNSAELTGFYVFFALVTIGIPLAGNLGEAFSYYKQTYIKIGIMTLPSLGFCVTFNTIKSPKHDFDIRFADCVGDDLQQGQWHWHGGRNPRNSRARFRLSAW